jgi:hypothetical protein
VQPIGYFHPAGRHRPNLLSNKLEVIKLTFPGSVVGIPEGLYQACQAQGLTYNPAPIVEAAIVSPAVAVGPVVEPAGKPGTGKKKMETLRTG